MKTNLLFHIGSLRAGGAEKSLVSLLNILPKEKYNIDLLVYEKKGLFYPLIPKEVNVIEMPMPLKCLYVSPTNIKFYLHHSPLTFLRKIYGTFKIKNASKEYALEQLLWNIWKEKAPIFEKKYDIAISYLEGFTNYFIIDKVQSKKKFLWIHNEYDKLKYNRSYDEKYFSQASGIITISTSCKSNLEKNFPKLKEKIHILENISDPYLIKRMAKTQIESDIFSAQKATKIVSVGRLSVQKNYRLAIEAAAELKKRGLFFEWIIIGEGPLRKELEHYRDALKLRNEIKFIGLRANPYAYMDKADIIVQCSLFEGKSIAIDEAKILNKAAVCTNYQTVFDIIKNEETGIITEMTAVSLANGIFKLAKDVVIKNKIITNLKNENFNNLAEVDKYIELFR